jgi:hypothetical protein
MKVGVTLHSIQRPFRNAGSRVLRGFTKPSVSLYKTDKNDSDAFVSFCIIYIVQRIQCALTYNFILQYSRMCARSLLKRLVSQLKKIQQRRLNKTLSHNISTV